MHLRNFKIKKRILVVVMLLVTVSGAMAAFNLIRMNSINRSYNEKISKNTQQVYMLDAINSKFLNLRIAANTVLGYRSEPNLIDSLSKNVTKACEEYDSAINDYNDYIQANDLSMVNDDFVNTAKQLGVQYSDSFEILKGILGNSASEVEQRRGEVVQVSDEIYKLLNTEIESLKTANENVNIAAQKTFTREAAMSILFQVALLVVSIILTVMLTNSIIKPIICIEEIAKKAALGNMDFEIDTKGKDEITNLSKNIGVVFDKFQAIISDMNKVIEEINAGKLSDRMDAALYDGVYRSMVLAFNSVIDGMANDIMDTVNYIEDCANGYIAINIRTFPGEKAVINKGLNVLKNNLVKLIDDIDMLSRASSEGMLDTRINPEEYSGEWKIIVEKLNGVLVEIINPVRESISVLEKMKQGTLSARVEGDYKGEYAAMKQALNQSLDTIEAYIMDTSEKLVEISNQNLNITLDKVYIGDFAPFKTSINRIIDNLNSIMVDIQSSSRKVSSVARVISDSAKSLSVTTVEQDKALESLQASVTDVQNKSAANVELTVKADELASKTKEIALLGNREMEELVVQMDEINAASKNISNIINVIDDIAFQTNLLSLNAAVEAARAGENGKGFAIVAEEVRNLALRSANAAKDISGLIQGTVMKASQGTEIANETAATLQSIVEHISKISDYIENVKHSSKKEIEEITTVNQVVGQISQISQVNSKASIEGAGSSEELLKHADLFNGMVNRFTLKAQSSESVQSAAAAYAQAGARRAYPSPRPDAKLKTENQAIKNTDFKQQAADNRMLNMSSKATWLNNKITPEISRPNIPEGSAINLASVIGQKPAAGVVKQKTDMIQQSPALSAKLRLEYEETGYDFDSTDYGKYSR